MDRYAQLMKNYLKEQDPDRYKRLQKAGDLKWYCQNSSNEANDRVQQLMNAGMMYNEAEEVALKEMMS